MSAYSGPGTYGGGTYSVQAGINVAVTVTDPAGVSDLATPFVGHTVTTSTLNADAVRLTDVRASTAAFFRKVGKGFPQFVAFGGGIVPPVEIDYGDETGVLYVDETGVPYLVGP